MNKTLNSLADKTVLITGAAGFIGAALAARLLESEPHCKVVGVDSLNSYYDVRLKTERLAPLKRQAQFHFIQGNIADKAFLSGVFAEWKPQIVVNLAAQAGVRYSIDHPDAYIESNMVGFYNVLEACRHNEVEHLVYASSSSVYGNGSEVPFSTEQKTDNPVSLYAATKKSNELMAHAYSKLFDLPATGLRFFTVYGPAGRPDMAYFKFTQSFERGEKVQIFNHGHCERDFTYIEDIVEGVVRVMKGAPVREKGADGLPVPPHSVYNIGSGRPQSLLDFIQILQEELVAACVLSPHFDFEAHKELVPMQPGDVAVTFADTTALEADFGYRPQTTLREGLRHFAEWYAAYNC